MNMLTITDFPSVDPDFDDLEELYFDAEADCVGCGDDELELASDEQEKLYEFWCQFDERHQDKLDRRSK
jgi:hypothetical protein